MISRLIIENFQSHEKTELNLDPGVNVITGASQSGKTAILRALYWLVHNRPSGNRFMSSFSKGATKVMLKTGEGQEIWHVKDDKSHSYLIGNTMFDKVGVEIPDQIKTALRMSELNVQRQLDEPFLITSSAGEVAKTINRITRLEMVDRWVTDLTQQINSTNRDKQRIDNEIEEIGKKIKSYRHLAELQPILDRGKKIVSQIERLNERRTKINNLYNKIDEATVKVYRLSNRLRAGEIILEIDKIEAKRLKLSERAVAVRSALKAHASAHGLKKASEQLEKAVAAGKKYDELRQKRNLMVEALQAERNLRRARNGMDISRDELTKAMKKQNKCPTCLQIIDKRVIEKILEGV